MHDGASLHSASPFVESQVERSLYLPSSQVFELTQAVLVAFGTNDGAAHVVVSVASVSLSPAILPSPGLIYSHLPGVTPVAVAVAAI